MRNQEDASRLLDQFCTLSCKDDTEELKETLSKIPPHLPYSSLVFEDGNYFIKMLVVERTSKEDLMMSGTTQAYLELKKRFEITNNDLYHLIQTWPQQTAICLLLKDSSEIDYTQLTLHAISCRASIEIINTLINKIPNIEAIDSTLFMRTVFSSVRSFQEILDYSSSTPFNSKLGFFNQRATMILFYYRARTLGFSLQATMIKNYLEAFQITVRQ